MIIINSLQGRASAPGGQEASSHVHSPPCCLPQQHLERRYHVCTCVFVCVYLCVGVYSVCVCIWGVCMYLCASVYVHVCVSVSVLSLCVRASVCISLCTYVGTGHVSVYLSSYTRVWVCMTLSLSCLWVCVEDCVVICMCVCVFVHICDLCVWLWICLTARVCVCVCVFPPPCPMLQKLSMQPQTGFPLWSFTAQARLFATWPDARLHQWQLSCFLCWHSITPETLTGVLRKCIYLLTAQNDPLQPENEIQAEWYLLQGILISHQLFS